MTDRSMIDSWLLHVTKGLCITIVYKWQWHKTRCHARGHSLTSVWLPFNDVWRFIILGNYLWTVFYLWFKPASAVLYYPLDCAYGEGTPLKGTSFKVNYSSVVSSISNLILKYLPPAEHFPICHPARSQRYQGLSHPVSLHMVCNCWQDMRQVNTS